MALTKNYNYKRIQLPDAYFKVTKVSIDYGFKKTAKTEIELPDGEIEIKDVAIEGRALADIVVYQNKAAKERGDLPIDLIEDVPFEGDNFVYDPLIKPTITGTISYKNGGGKDNLFDLTDPRYLVYTKLKTIKPKNENRDFTVAKDC